MYQYYIDGIMLPVAPPSMSTKIKNKNTTAMLLNGEEINIIKSAGLTDVSFTVLLPNQQYPFSVYTGGIYMGAQYYLDLFEKLKLSNQPFLFYVIRTDDSGKIVYQGSTSENEKPYYTLESYTIDEDAEQYGIDASVSLSLKQYRSYGTSAGSIQIEQYGQNVAISNKRDTTGKQTPKNYTVKKGDTLWNICKKELGDGAKYKEVAQKNGIASPNNIYPGQIINFEL